MADFLLRREQLAREACVNRENPEVPMCAAMCYLVDQLDPGDRGGNGTSLRPVERSADIVFTLGNTRHPFPERQPNLANFHGRPLGIATHAPRLHTDFVFRPPNGRG